MHPDARVPPGASRQYRKKIRRKHVRPRPYLDERGNRPPMNIAGYLQKFQTSPACPRAGAAGRTLRKLAAERLGISEAAVMAYPERELSQPQWRRLCADAQALASGTPPAYVFGTVPFMDWTFAIDPRALIPRPETEALCARVVEIRRDRPHPKRILDLCCGSGVLGLSLGLVFPEAKITLCDISPEALDLSAENSARHGMRERVSFYPGDLWRALDFESDARFDLIVANPPYVAPTDEVECGVRHHEPALALFSEDGGAAHIKGILAELSTHLSPAGTAALEVGHEHASTLSSWLEGRFGRESYRWERDPFGVRRYLFFEGGATTAAPGQ